MTLYQSEFITSRILFMMDYGFTNIERFDDYIIANGKYYYPLAWLENDYIFFNKICRIDG